MGHGSTCGGSSASRVTENAVKLLSDLSLGEAPASLRAGDLRDPVCRSRGPQVVEQVAYGPLECIDVSGRKDPARKWIDSLGSADLATRHNREPRCHRFRGDQGEWLPVAWHQHRIDLGIQRLHI